MSIYGMRKYTTGFTLLELSIVLAIIGLLVGGVLVGRDLIRAARLQSVMSDMRQFVSAINNFKLKYSALPGDMRNAETFWGSVPANDCPDITVRGVYPQTCNGNGDGKIGVGFEQRYEYWSVSIYTETLRAWQQLSAAGLIQGTFPGGVTQCTPPGSANNNPVNCEIINVAGVNVPASRFPGAGYAMFYLGQALDSGGRFFNRNDGYGHVIIFGRQSNLNVTNYLSVIAYPIITPVEASSMDQKLDDGRPGSGDIMSMPKDSGYTPACTTSTLPATAAYNVTDHDIRCSLIFVRPF